MPYTRRVTLKEKVKKYLSVLTNHFSKDRCQHGLQIMDCDVCAKYSKGNSI